VSACATYHSADLKKKSVDFQVDLRRLPFESAQYDLVYASHVLEHIQEDSLAITEIRRILKPNGIAILPVPILGEKTIEYAEPNPQESYHVRAPGLDYYDRYSKYFSRVAIYSSEDFPSTYQPFMYYQGQWRGHWPAQPSFLRVSELGPRLSDFVPVCFV
jgi:ubiquinone/menaquinone biosynthesis C-methylase UbiE